MTDRNAGPALALVVAVAAAPGAARADWDDQERNFGATNVHAQAGNGGLTAGFAATGELTVLGWPSPSFYDQLDYQTSDAEDAREQPYLGADPNEGVFAGLFWETGDDAGLAWLRDEPFETEQSYRSDTSGVVVTRHRWDELGLTVTAESLVRIDADVLATRYVVTRDADSPVRHVVLLAYENLAPCLTREPYLPLTDWLFDSGNDFGAFYASDPAAVVHFLPAEGDLSLLDGWLAQAWDEPGALQAAVDEQWQALVETAGDGVYLAFAGRDAPDQVQVGMDGTQPCASNTGWGHAPQDAFEDADDGELSGSAAAGCQVTAALGWRRDFTADPGALEVAVFLAAATSADAALDALDDSRALDWEALVSEVDDHWAGILDGAYLPDTDDEEVLAFARRTLISLLQGTDRDTGSVVAAITTQPPYREDWPRDAAFIDLALDVAGLTDAATAHKRFLLGVQETEDHTDVFGNVTPAGAWHMNFYADGEYGGHIPFEIDATGLFAWSLWAHARYLSSESERRAFLRDAVPALILAGDLLSTCVDEDYPYGDGSGDVREQLAGDVAAGRFPDNDEERAAALDAGDFGAFIQCLAQEDDDEELVQTLYGAHTVRLGLLAAAAALRATCGDEERAAWYETRAGELARAMVGLWASDTGGWEGRSDWVLWPEAALDADDARMAALAEERLDLLRRSVELETDGASYVNKASLALARHWADDADRLAELEPLIRALAVDVPTEGTRHVGEAWVSLDADGDGTFDTFDNRVAVPHLWTASLTYLSLMALDAPERFQPAETDVDWFECSDAAVELTETVDGCTCGLPPRGRPGAAGALVLAALAAGAGLRRRRSP